MFRGEKSTTFWIGLGILGFSIYQFCIAIWQTIYYFFIYGHIYPQEIAPLSGTSYNDYVREVATFQYVVPALIGGIIFLVIGLYIMKVGSKKQSIIN
jgi:hypothetical protein